MNKEYIDICKFDLSETVRLISDLRFKERLERMIHLDSKKAYKQMRILYWDHPEMRQDQKFLKAVELSLITYKHARNVHVMTGDSLHHFKKVYKEEQRKYQEAIKEGQNEEL